MGVTSHFARIYIATVGEDIRVVRQESRHWDTGSTSDRITCSAGLYHRDDATILALQTQAEVLTGAKPAQGKLI